MTAKTDDPATAARAEVTAWFFEDYLPRWVAAAQGAEAPEFIHQYWGTPMHVTGLEQSFWCLDDASVLGFLDFNWAPLRAAGYSHTVVPDRRVFVYSSVGAAIEVIWSRRSADEVEIQRWATHFEVAKSEHGWRVVGIQATATDKNSLDEVWPRGSAVGIDG
ncbi:hypothetical protein ACIHDR_12515 [Nocardia sp. NPDC052278]|uniref:DUF6841 family protein n=1 Tax=unclassified Nocardia TaxID=2637762 RepID=UPI0036C2FF67